MRNLIVISLLIFAIPSLGQVSVKNLHVVSEDSNGLGFIYRGSAPYNDTHYEQLFSSQFQKIIIFKIQNKSEVDEEIYKLIKAGFSKNQIIHIQMKWKDFAGYREICAHTKEALLKLVESYQTQTRTFFHCTAGEDRTGFLDGLFQLYIGTQASLVTAYSERLCSLGYSSGRPNKPKHITEPLEKEMTKYFEIMGNEVIELKRNNLPIKELNCEKELNISDFQSSLLPCN